MVDIIGFLQLFILLKVQIVQRVIYLVEENQQMKRYKKLKDFMNSGKKKKDKKKLRNINKI